MCAHRLNPIQYVRAHTLRYPCCAAHTDERNARADSTIEGGNRRGKVTVVHE